MNAKQLGEANIRDLDVIEKIIAACEKDKRAMTAEEQAEFHRAEDAIKLRAGKIKALQRIDDDDEGEVITATGRRKADSRQQRAADLLEGIWKTNEKGVGATAQVKGHLLGDRRAAMTPDIGSAGNALWRGTSQMVYTQATSSTAILRETTIREARNNLRMAYLDRDDRTEAQNKAYTGQLSQQAYVLSAVTTAMKNYYAMILWHNDVQRDDAGNIGEVVFQAAASDIQRSILSDLLSADGSSNNLTGLDNYSGVLSIDAGSASISDWSLLSRARKALEDVNCNWENASILMAPALTKQFIDLADSTGQPLQLPGGLANLQSRWYTSSIVAEAGGLSTIYIGDFSKMDIFTEGTYDIILRERFADYDQSAFLMVQRVDMKLREPDHLLRITNVATS